MLIAPITRTMRNVLLLNGIDRRWAGVSLRVIHGGYYELCWPPELTPRLVFAVAGLPAPRHLQKIQTYESLQFRMFNAWKAWRTAA